MQAVDLSKFDNSWYDPGRSSFVRAAWFFFGSPVLRSSLLPSSAVRRGLLRVFGARVGQGVVIRPGVRIKYPWLLEIEKNTWIGEDVWVDNLARIQIGANVCVSQGAYFCTGNHDWTDPAFGLMVRPISVGDGAWIGAKAILCPGVEVAKGAIASAGSVVTANLAEYTIYAGNPAAPVKIRIIAEEPAHTGKVQRLPTAPETTRLPAKS